MTPRPPQSSPFPQEQDSPRSNPWGSGPIESPPADAAPQPVAPPADSGVLNLQCPQCGSGLKLRREYVGVEGACVQCGTAIKAVAFANGQIGIELIQAENARFSSGEVEPPPAVVETEAVPAQSQPSVEPPAPLPQEPQPSSLWQPAETPVETEQSVPSAFGAPDLVSPQPQAETPSMPSPPEEASPNAWGQGEPVPPAEPPRQEAVPAFFNQEAATPEAPPLQPETNAPQQLNQFAPEQQAPAPPFPQPPVEQAFPSAAAAGGAWANAASPEPPGVDSFQNFKAASPFDTEAEVEEPEMPQPTGQPQVTVAAGKNNPLGRSKRRGNYGFLKTIAVALVLGGLVFAAIVFVPKEKLDQGKKWALEFVKPVLEALNSRGDEPAQQPPVEISNPSVDPGAPAPQPATVSEATPAQAAVPASEPSKPNVVPDTQPANAASESLRVNLEGGAAIREFYSIPEIKNRVGLVLNPGKVASEMEAFYSETPELPGLVSVKFQKAVRSNDSGRWFGIFEVDESDDDKIHRWVVVEDEAGEFKLDWAMYEQTINNGLQRFLDDPTAGSREFRVSVVRGDVVPEQNNPWNSEAIGLYIKSPFDGQAARPIILKATDYQELGFSKELVGTDPKLAQLELTWVPSEYNPDSSVPVVTKLIGWGAW